MLALVKHPPADVAAAPAVRSMHPSFTAIPRAALAEALRQGARALKKRTPSTAPCTAVRPGYDQRLKAMLQWRRTSLPPMALEPYLMLANDVVQWFARHPASACRRPCRQLRNWQKKNCRGLVSEAVPGTVLGSGGMPAMKPPWYGGLQL